MIRLTALALALLAPLSANAALIHHSVSSLATPDPSDGYGPIATSIPVELDAELDHMTGFVTINRFEAIQGGSVVVAVPPHSAQLTLNSNGLDYSGDTPHGHIDFWPIGAHHGGFLFAFYPNPGEPVALLVQTPEPSGLGLALIAIAGGGYATRRVYVS